MSKENRDIENFDYLDVFINEDYFDDVEKSYECFGWKLLCKGETKVFSSTIEATFSRDRKIKNKDELQFEQVAMEEEYSVIARKSKYRYKFSVIFGLIIGILASIIIATFTYFALSSDILVEQVLDAVIIALALMLIGILLFALSIIKAAEDKYFETEVHKVVIEIKKICDRAKKLLENVDGQTEH